MTMKNKKNAPSLWDHVSIRNIAADEIVTDHQYGSNYREPLSEEDIVSSASAIEHDGMPEPPWAMAVGGKCFHVAGDKRLAGMRRLGWRWFTYRVIDAEKLDVAPESLALQIRTVSDQVRPLSFAERVRQIRQHAAVGMSAKDIGVRISLQTGYISGLLKLDKALPAGWEVKVNAKQAQDLYSASNIRAAWKLFLETGRTPEKEKGGENGRPRGQAANKEKFKTDLAAVHGEWTRHLPWQFITVGGKKAAVERLDATLRDFRQKIEASLSLHAPSGKMTIGGLPPIGWEPAERTPHITPGGE